MLEWFRSLMLAHADFAPWYLFGAILLAGFNLPVSIDILLVAAALLAATALPEKMWHLFAAVSIGCYLSAGFRIGWAASL